MKVVLLLAVVSVFAGLGYGELAPLSFLPDELIQYFHPLVHQEENTFFAGKVQRVRREVEEGFDGSGDSFEESVFTVSHKYLGEDGQLKEEKCMMIQTKIKIEIRFRLKGAGVGKRVYDMPTIPDKVNGTCALETETAKMFIFWPGFNLSLVFTKNPEGNSYYMNRAVVVYDKSSSALRSDFSNALTGGKVKLETIPDKNFFWTPLGKSYSCQEPEDQGPLKLFNVIDDEIEGTISFANTRFQPFMKRAGGVWGNPVQCLPRATRDIRDQMPFITASLVLLVSCLLVAGYGIQRTFFPDSKVEYGTYGEEKHEMQQVRTEEEEPLKSTEEPVTAAPNPAQQATTTSAAAPQAAENSANPFKAKSSNPFQNYGST